MTSFLKNNENPLKYVNIIPAGKSHIHIRNKKVCLDCENKPCTYYCPARVFFWEVNEIKILFERCIECGACPWGCPRENIDWVYPPGGYGVKYEV
ncbi:ferredoxin family protein [Halothermothrix orenii]|uniref:Ferredoxin-like protein n=1 Tax=Halothermothrix orenii (strain H 168 / OCM 544 / DSM 9562) TaxID=373903 RepID=B8CZP6_HALOH|nr:4Fe-4S dicluster domain-containing protein [Halothermothrix orenii]ACL68776.1 4Fe-4S ferredoxin iron-sulfur binding domain protein [Halothermothrix orenii H 168]